MPRPNLRTSHFYFASIISVGGAVTAWSAIQLLQPSVSADWLVLAALTALTGSFTVKIPSVEARISVSDTFVFTSALLFGPPAATVIVAADCLVAAFWGKRTKLQSAFNITAPALSVWLAAHAFYSLSGIPPGGQHLAVTELLFPLFALAAVYFVFNSGFVAVAVAFERGANAWHIWKEHFPLFSLNYFGGVSVAVLLVSYTREIDFGAIGIILPLLLISYLTHRAALGRVQDAHKHVEQVNELYMSTIETLAMAVDAKDQITHGHIRRVQVYAVELAKLLGVREAKQLRAIEAAALLHDMGKLAIPEHILNKPGKLTPAEFDKMKRHADIGADLLSEIRFPYPVVPIVRHHHEHWNGTGYPSKISGTDIPLGARILSVVDCFDALNSDRPYRPRLRPEEAFEILRERRGSMYDPLVVDTFIAAFPQIAPAAEKAGREARSIIDGSLFDQPEPAPTTNPLLQISESATQATALRRCREEIIQAHSVAAAVQTAAQSLRQLTAAAAVAVYEYRPDSDVVVCEAVEGDRDGLILGLSIPLGERITGWTASTRRLTLNSDASLDLGNIARAFDPPLRSATAAILHVKDELRGVLTLYSPRADAFRDEDRYVVETVAEALALRLGSDHLAASVVRFPQKRH